MPLPLILIAIGVAAGGGGVGLGGSGAKDILTAKKSLKGLDERYQAEHALAEAAVRQTNDGLK